MTRTTIVISVSPVSPVESVKVAIARKKCVNALRSQFGGDAQGFIAERESSKGPSVWRRYVWWEEGRVMFIRKWLIKDFNLYTEGGDTSESSSV